MNISPVGFQPYVYRVNSISSSSMNRVSAISDDVLSSKVDYSGLTGKNENELSLGQSRNFADIILQQMSQSGFNASRVMQPPEEEMISEVQEDVAQNVMEEMNYNNNADPSLFQKQNAAKMYEMSMFA